MSDNTAQQALAMPMIEAQVVRTPWPREFLTLGLVAASLSFWTVVILAITHLG